MTASTLIIAGEADAIPCEAMAGWVAAIFDAHLVPLPGAGHFPHAEVPDQYFGSVDDFLTEG